jgi:hypothetical protein
MWWDAAGQQITHTDTDDLPKLEYFIQIKAQDRVYFWQHFVCGFSVSNAVRRLVPAQEH